MELSTIVLGLGNPGARYRLSRHNLGFWVLDRLAKSRGLVFGTDPLMGGKVWTAEYVGARGTVVLAKPRTYMNRSGRAAVALAERYDAQPEKFVVVYDDADLELGRLRVRPSGRAGGHNGLRSLFDVWRTEEFPRVRLGVRGEQREEVELADYVLAAFPDDERPVARALAELGADAVESILDFDVLTAMNAFNGRRAGAAENEDPREQV